MTGPVVTAIDSERSMLRPEASAGVAETARHARGAVTVSRDDSPRLVSSGTCRTRRLGDRVRLM